MTRRLVDVSQDVIVREEDCGTTEGIWVSDVKDGNEVIEPMISMQWFVKMKPLAEAAIEAVSSKETEFVPERFSKT